MLSNIKNLVFDLGNVIINIDIQKTVNAFNALGLDYSIISPRQEYTDTVLYGLETGKTTPEAFRNEVRKMLNNPKLSDEEINNAWCAMLLDTPKERIEMLKKLKSQYNLYLFSNTNRIHIDSYHQSFKEQFGFDFPSLFVQDFYSHEINDRKPNISAFEKVLSLAGINPTESLFIDDLEANIEGAQKAGLQGYWLKKGTEMMNIFR